jgi:hypothetical protein
MIATVVAESVPLLAEVPCRVHFEPIVGARRSLPYDKGRGFAWQALWVAVSTLVFTQVWCPNRLRCAILSLFGAQIGEGVVIRHRVTVQWPGSYRSVTTHGSGRVRNCTTSRTS